MERLNASTRKFRHIYEFSLLISRTHGNLYCQLLNLVIISNYTQHKMHHLFTLSWDMTPRQYQWLLKEQMFHQWNIILNSYSMLEQKHLQCMSLHASKCKTESDQLPKSTRKETRFGLMHISSTRCMNQRNSHQREKDCSRF